MMSRRKTILVGVAVAAVVALLAASAQAAKPPLKIMLIANLAVVPGTSSFPEIGDAVRGAVNDINRHGGVGGQKISLQVCDPRGDANLEAQCARQAVSSGVVALVGSWSISSSHLSITGPARIPDIGLYQAAAISYTYPTVFPLIGGALSAVAGPAAALADGAGVKKVSIINSNEPAALATNTATMHRVFDPRNVDFTVTTMSPGTADPSPYIQQALRSDPGGAMFFVSGADNDRLTTLMHQLRPNVIVSRSATSMTSATIQNLGEAVQGMVVSSQYLPSTAISNRGVRQWVADAQSVNKDTALSDFSANGWASVQVFAQAALKAQKLGGVTRARLIRVLNTSRAFDPKIGPKVSFVEPLLASPAVQGTNYTRVFNVKVTYSKIVNSKFVWLNTGFFDPFIPKKK